MILEERKTLRMTFWMVEMSGDVPLVEEADEEEDNEDNEDTVEEGRGGLLLCLPWLMLTTG
jgi:hypothetical protein